MDELIEKDLKNLDASTTDIVNKLVQEEDPAALKNLTQLFNMNQIKKNFIRVDALSKLIDSVTAQMADRLRRRSDEFTNAELLSYMQTLQTAMEKSSKTLNMDDTPMIQLNQVNIDVKDETLDRDSKNKITDAVKKILNRLAKEQTEPTFEPIAPVEETLDDIAEKEAENFSNLLMEDENETNS